MTVMKPRRIAVFGSSEPLPGEPLYEEASEIGRLLALRGHTVLTGGYGGVMEGASRGAQEAGGTTEGVTCAIFDHRDPNPYVEVRHPTDDLLTRTTVLIEKADGFITLGGKAGTLAELAQLWALDRAGCLTGRPVILLGQQWEGLLPMLGDLKLLESQQLKLSQVVRSPQAAAETLDAFYAGLD